MIVISRKRIAPIRERSTEVRPADAGADLVRGHADRHRAFPPIQRDRVDVDPAMGRRPDGGRRDRELGAALLAEIAKQAAQREGSNARIAMRTSNTGEYAVRRPSLRPVASSLPAPALLL